MQRNASIQIKINQKNEIKLENDHNEEEEEDEEENKTPKCVNGKFFMINGNILGFFFFYEYMYSCHIQYHQNLS